MVIDLITATIFMLSIKKLRDKKNEKNKIEDLKYSAINALEIDPENPDLLYMLAYAFYKDNRFSNNNVTKKILKKALEYESEHNESLELLHKIGDKK